jgi:hypothetical protein
MTNRIVAIQEDGSHKDITEGVQICYDLLRQSLDWGSGFLDTQEVDAVVRLANDADFADFEELIRGLWASRRKQWSPGSTSDYPGAMEQISAATKLYETERDAFVADIVKED